MYRNAAIASPAVRRAVPEGSLALNRVQNILNNDIKRQITTTTGGNRKCCFDQSFVSGIYSFVSLLSVFDGIRARVISSFQLNYYLQL